LLPTLQIPELDRSRGGPEGCVADPAQGSTRVSSRRNAADPFRKGRGVRLAPGDA
jgi:hypothetical protein